MKNLSEIFNLKPQEITTREQTFIDIKSTYISAGTRKLKTKWTTEMSNDLEAFYGPKKT